jgi:hypothetical protein
VPFRTPVIERRQFGRRKTSLGGWVCIRGRPKVPCSIHNLSVTGALLALEVPKWLPYRFKLTIDGSELPYSCEIRHMKPHFIGVLFVDAHAEEKERAGCPNAGDVEEWLGRNSTILLNR